MSAQVLTGIDVLQHSEFEPIKRRRVGLITHRPATNRRGVSVFDVFRESQDVNLVSVFTPEHGYAAQWDETVPSSIDSESGIMFHSLYGETRRPTAEALDGIEVLVCDLQDVGARFYTYIATVAYALEEAAKHSIEFIVLDRPNPINGVLMEGPVLETGVESFVGYFHIPIRHGMTIGEIAQWHALKAGLNVNLEIIRCEDWQRRMWFDETGLPWSPPSPAMRSLATATLYPGVCCMERMNISVGRGTDLPFECVGAPWIDEEELVQNLESRDLTGVTCEAITFSPTRSVYADQVCHGVSIEITDREALNSVQLGLHLLDAIHRQNPVELDFRDSLPLIGDARTLTALQSYLPIHEIFDAWQEPLRQFEDDRKGCLLYHDNHVQEI